jgi:hypothetical protein
MFSHHRPPSCHDWPLILHGRRALGCGVYAHHRTAQLCMTVAHLHLFEHDTTKKRPDHGRRGPWLNLARPCQYFVISEGLHCNPSGSNNVLKLSSRDELVVVYTNAM